jgi:peptidoglycan/xylan/chitin deacetylase (PgdA/CDA1 family)
MKRALKLAALETLRSSGVFSLSTQVRRKDSLVILCYHGISLRDEHEWEGGLYIPPARFRLALEWLRAWDANVLPLAEGLERLRNGTLPPRSVVLTFDDGFYDFHRFALPVLKEFGYPCTLYLTTYYGRHRVPIFNLAISYLLWKGRGPGLSPEARHAEVRGMMERTETFSTEAKNEFAAELAASMGIDYNQLVEERLFQIMTPEETAEAARAGIDIELHTHRHRTPLDRELFTREIRDNASAIREITGRTPVHFCYPSGLTAPEFLPWLRECSVESATTCVHGLARPASDPLMLPRYLDGCGATRLDFESWLSGLR